MSVPRLVLVPLVLLLAGGSAGAHEEETGPRRPVRIGVDAAFVLIKPAGEKERNGAGTSQPLDQRIGLRRPGTVPRVRVDLPLSQGSRGGHMDLRLRAWEGTWEGRRVLDRGLGFDGLGFAPGDAIDSRIRIQSVDLALAWSFLHALVGGGTDVQVGLSADRSEVRLRKENTQEQRENAFLSAFPYLGLHGHGGLEDPVAFDMEFKVGFIELEHHELGLLFEFEPGVRFRFGPRAALRVGYGLTYHEMRDEGKGRDDEVFRFKMNGLTLGLEATF